LGNGKKRTPEKINFDRDQKNRGKEEILPFEGANSGPKGGAWN